MILEKMNQGFPPFEGTGRGLYQPDLFADRGFTSHEFLKWFNVYNMNGRLFDPLAGRFLNADPCIQDATNSQNYNRYSYCLNNPLRFTDPSGYRMAALDEYWNLGKDITNQDRFYGFSNGGGGWGGNGGAVPDWANGNYHYDSNTGAYTNPLGDIVPFSKVNSNYIQPNASERYTITQNAYSLDGEITFTGSGTFSLVRVGGAVEATGLYPTFTSRDGGLNYLSSLTNRSPQGQGGDGWLNTLNIVNTWACTGAFATGKVLSETRLGSNIGYQIAYNAIGNATKYLQPVGVGTSIVGASIGLFKFSGTENRTWGVYGQLGVSLLSSGLTLSGVTAPVGIVLGGIDAFGGFNGFYNYLDNQQQLYNSTGGLLVPVFGVPSYFQLNRK